MHNDEAEAVDEVGRDAPASLSRLEFSILLATLVALYSALPTAIVRDALKVNAPLWPLYLAIYGSVGLILATRLPRGRWLAPQALLIGYSMLPILSATWSEVPLETLLQSATLLGTVVVGLCFVVAVPPHQALRVFAFACVVGATLDLLVSAGVPRLGVHQDGPWLGTWKGLHDQKNGLGSISALTIMILMAAARAKGRLGVGYALGLAIAVVMLAASKSTTSWLVAASCVPFLFLNHAARRTAAMLVPAVMTAAIAAMIIVPDLAASLLEALPQLVGKDSTLSNRLPIWIVVDPFLQDRWWLGYGYGTFWSPAVLPSDLFQTRMFFVPSSAHSSYIEMRLALGMLGIAATLVALVYVVGILAAAHLAEAKAGAPRNPVLPLVLPFLLFLSLTSLTESVLLMRNSIIWVMFVWLSGAAARQAFAERGTEAAPVPATTGSVWLRVH